MNTLKPKPLHKGATIAVVAPSRWPNPERLARGVKALEDKEFNVKVHPQCHLRFHQSAGTHAQKLAALHEVFADPTIDAIWCAAGGNRTLHLLDGLDFELIRQNPKPLIGFSDITALLSAITQKTGLVTFHGPVVALSDMMFPHVLDNALDVLYGQVMTYPLVGAEILTPGTATGQLMGGNLCLLTNLLGTEFAPDFRGKIVFVEDQTEPIRNLDRMLLKLRRSGKLDGAAAILFGDFTEMTDTEAVPFGLTVRELVLEHVEGLNIPIVMNAPFGHGAVLPTFPLGVQAKLTASGPTPTLQLLESATR